MSKTILYRWFGLGKIPERERMALESEGIVLAEEGVGCTVTMKNICITARPGICL